MTTPTSESADRVRAVVARLAPARVPEPADDHRLAEDLGYDSLTLLELAVTLEKEFALPPVSDGEAMDVLTVGDVVDLVRGAAVQEP